MTEPFDARTASDAEVERHLKILLDSQRRESFERQVARRVAQIGARFVAEDAAKAEREAKAEEGRRLKEAATASRDAERDARQRRMAEGMSITQNFLLTNGR